jgi:hypothetical protein
VRLPTFKLDSSPVSSALDQLCDQAFKADERNGRFQVVPRPNSALGTGLVSIDLKDVTVSEALKYVMELSGCSFEVRNDQIYYDVAHDRTDWRSLRPACFIISETLAAKWFPGAHTTKASEAPPVCPAESILSKMGILFPPDATADFVPGINALAVTLPAVGSDCLETLIEESESELLIVRIGAGESKLPEGMKLVSLPVRDGELEVFKTVLVRNDDVLQPFCGSTALTLRFLGASFSKGSAAWLERKTQTLQVINTEPNLKTIQTLLAPK